LLMETSYMWESLCDCLITTSEDTLKPALMVSAFLVMAVHRHTNLSQQDSAGLALLYF
jgi:hypothetical protein